MTSISNFRFDGAISPMSTTSPRRVRSHVGGLTPGLRNSDEGGRHRRGGSQKEGSRGKTRGSVGRRSSGPMVAQRSFSLSPQRK